MGDPIDLNAERNKRAQPDPEFIRKDDYGRPLFNYGLSYEFGGSMWATELWAYSMEDAQARVDAMRESLLLLGQTFTMIPA